MSRPRRLPIDERLEEAARLVVRSRIFLDIWFYFESKDTRPAIIDTMDRFSDYFQFDSHAHFVAFIVHIAALFEKRNNTINLPDLAREFKQSRALKSIAVVHARLVLISQRRRYPDAQEHRGGHAGGQRFPVRLRQRRGAVARSAAARFTAGRLFNSSLAKTQNQHFQQWKRSAGQEND